MVNNKPDSHWTIVTIVNWGSFQGDPADEGQPAGQPEDKPWTGTGQAEDNQRTHKKNSKKVKNEKSPLGDGYTDDFELWWTHVPKATAKRDASKAFKPAIDRIAQRPGLDRTTAVSWLIERTKQFATSVADTEDRFIKTPGPWLRGDCFDDTSSKVRRQVNSPSLYEANGYSAEEVEKHKREREERRRQKRGASQ